MSYRESDPYLVYAFYHFTEIEEPSAFAKKWQKELDAFDVKGRIYIHQDGVNATCSIAKEKKSSFEAWLKNQKGFADVFLKIHSWDCHTFARLNVRTRPNLVAMNKKCDLTKRAEHVSPKKWKELLQRKDILHLDVRNQFEYELGHFEGAIAPDCKTFKEYSEKIEQLAKEHDPKTTEVMMSCTGGIRCEIYSPLLKEAGFEKIYQLDGGVINYGLQEGSEHWKGKLFVFDDRMSIDISEDPADPIAPCHHCEKTTCDNVYNCANMDCNYLFFCCDQCLQKHQGCCCNQCAASPHARPLEDQKPHRPFRRGYKKAIKTSSS